MTTRDATDERPAHHDLLRDAPAVVRFVVCAVAFAIPVSLVLVAHAWLHFWPVDVLVGVVGLFLFLMLVLGPLRTLGAVDVDHVPPDRDGPSIARPRR